jgi:prophage regulatory protein
MQNAQPAAPAKRTKKPTTTSPQDRPTRLIRLPEVKGRVGLSRSSIYLRIAAGTFPRPVRLGEKSVAWSEAAIDSWIAARLENHSTQAVA